jgi:REP element-mobilizing transposase RayT
MRNESGPRARRSIRLKGYDYSQPGGYFVTIATRDRAAILGRLASDGVRLTALGERVDRAIRSIPHRFPNAQVDTWVIMPDHVHLLIVIDQAPSRSGPGRGEAAAPAPSTTVRMTTAASPATVDVETTAAPGGGCSSSGARAGEAAVDGLLGPGAAGGAAASPLRDGVGAAGNVSATGAGEAAVDGLLGPGAAGGAAASPLRDGVGAAGGRVTRARGTAPGSVAAIVQRLKSQVSRWQGARGGAESVWQRGYYEHVVRSPAELERLRGYVRDNPGRAWERSRGRS